jgi:shikimate dehydrogenase
MNRSQSVDRYAVMGNPIKHSKSPIIHREFAHQTDQDMSYQSMLVPLDGFAEAVRRFREEGGKGANVTLPFKEQAFELADERTERAERARAVNTLIFTRQGKVRGDNTDGVGLVRDIINNLDGRLTSATILVLGAGGAVRGVLAPLLKELPLKITIANRTFEKAHFLAEDFRELGKVEALPYSRLEGIGFDWIINGTSASLQGEVPGIPDSVIISGKTRCYDMMYASDPTPFMCWARDMGAVDAYDGLGMLVEQAAESFRLWRGITPLTRPVLAKLRHRG